MLAFLPIIGPIIQGIIGIFTKKMDTDVQKLTINREQDTEEAKVSAQIIQSTGDDLVLRLMRDMVCAPVAVWAMLMGYDTVIANKWPQWMWHVPNFPDSVGYLPYAVLVFLLGNIGINMWSRK